MYTKGPWRVEKFDTILNSGKSTGEHILIQSDFGGVCEIDIQGRHNKSEEKSNLNLIASAPDLLEACKDVLLRINELSLRPQFMCAVENLERFISKAEKGE